ncbi:uncharacterized protein CELE_Y38E10A.29 [Caenorhabditis elegans]|uniref:Secreted protein n=1 Tax=Caenorhabditis elegans TaxID=6239 RepID=B7FAS4_CAEEL|nr:Secreted protein [Caenorhabditis elegans]CAT01077.1 Secreted protein [Caenorhabditis elegans]|eukprot:NP_001254349.1 Nematode Specific Peptide family, group E [Caenorhabditis elegans]
MSSVVLLLLVLLGTVTSQYYPRPSRYQYYHYQQQPYRPHVVHNVVSDGVWGGPTSLGWAQVPRYLSPMYSPVYGG